MIYRFFPLERDRSPTGGGVIFGIFLYTTLKIMDQLNLITLHSIIVPEIDNKCSHTIFRTDKMNIQIHFLKTNYATFMSFCDDDVSTTIRKRWSVSFVNNDGSNAVSAVFIFCYFFSPIISSAAAMMRKIPAVILHSGIVARKSLGCKWVNNDSIVYIL